MLGILIKRLTMGFILLALGLQGAWANSFCSLPMPEFPSPLCQNPEPALTVSCTKWTAEAASQKL